MSYHSKSNAGQRTSGFIFVVLLHIVLIWGLAEALKHHAGDTLINIIKTKVVEEQKKVEDEPPPPPPPEKLPPPDFVPPPDFTIESAPVPQNTISVVSTEKPVAPPPKPRTEAKVAGKGLSKPEYPAASMRLGEEGVVEMNLLIGEDGRVSDVQITGSSGFERLDTATANHAKRSWKFIPCMENDKPVACWTRKKLRWNIEEEKKH